MRKWNETEIVVTMQMPGHETPMHVPGVLIMENMTAGEIDCAMMQASKFIVAELVARGKMGYFFKKRMKSEVPQPRYMDDGY